MAALLLLLAAAASVAAADPSRCLFSVTGRNGDPELYDFSSLATSEPWEVPEVSDSKSKSGVLFLSVCGPLRGLTTAQCPDPDASACLARKEGGQWRTVVASAAATSANASLSYNSSRLTLSLPGHTPCDHKKNFSVQVHLVCNKDAVAAPFFVALSGCVIELGWITAAACPAADGARACSYPAPNGHWYDLYPLANERAYQVAAPDGRVFYVNLCAPVADGLCPGEAAVACEANRTVALGRFEPNSGLQQSADGLVSRQKGDNESMVEIHYLCNQKAPLIPKPELLSAANGHAVFRVETPYACPAVPVDCVAYTREGVKVDLSSLRKPNGYWTLRDSRFNYTHITYYFNVCGPLARNLPSPCHAGNIGACVSSSKPNVPAQPMGVVEHPPKFNRDGELILTYRDGGLCPDGKNKRKVHLLFKCNHEERGPELEAVSGECVYTFLWKTPAACEAIPDKGDNCVVLDSRMLYAYYLTALYNNIQDYEVRVDGSLFRVNLCGSLHKTCNGHDNVSVCLLRNGTEIAIGMRNDTIEYMDGRLSLHLEGEECLPGMKSSVTVILACEHLDQNGPATQPQVFPSGVNDCRFFLVWNHHKACPPYTEVPCSVRADDGTLYDLSPLSWRSLNHLARARNGQFSGVSINVCRSVVFNRDAACEASSGACLKNGDKFINLGNVQSGPILESKVLKLKYDEGSLCHAHRGPVHVSTTITFMCDPDALESSPEYLGEFQCDHALFWRTAAACPLRPPSGFNCSVVSPYSKYRFDLSPLAGQDHTAVDDVGQHVLLAVCSPVSNASCPKGAGACQMTSSGGLSTGLSSAELTYIPGGTLKLRYQGGDACGVGRRRETVIEFFCGAEGSPEGPRVVEVLEGCVTVVHWHTRLACENPIHCTTSLLGHQTDLSSLVRVSQNYMVKLPEERSEKIFFMNVCRPLLPQTGLNCGAGAAACVASKVAGSLKQDLNLGFATSSPVVTADGAILVYSGGSPCPKRPSVNATTRISFKCDPLAGSGSPRFDKVTPDCQYYFSWPTSLVCGPIEEKVGDCKVYSSQLRRFISLENLGQQTKVGKFTVDLCGRGADCGGNAVCQRSSDGIWSSYGVLQKAVLHADYLKLHFGGGASCLQNETYGAEVWLKCDPDNGTGAPRVVLDHPCYAIFEWRTDAVCLQKAIPDAAGKEQEDTSPHNASTIVLLVLGVVCLSLGVVAIIFVRKRYPLMCLSWRPFPWPSSSSHTQVHYSRETLSTAY